MNEVFLAVKKEGRKEKRGDKENSKQKVIRDSDQNRINNKRSKSNQ